MREASASQDANPFLLIENPEAPTRNWFALGRLGRGNFERMTAASRKQGFASGQQTF